ncbi:hypothetical protein FRC06_005532, partial [Ceratobasidium sp. 370]
MVTFTPQVASAVIFFALVTDAVSAAPPGGGNMVPDLVQNSRSVENAAAAEEDETIQFFSSPSGHSLAIVYDGPPLLK